MKKIEKEWKPQTERNETGIIIIVFENKSILQK